MEQDVLLQGFVDCVKSSVEMPKSGCFAIGQ